MIGVAAGALASHWRRQPLQLAAIVLGLALVTGLWSAVQAINAAARADYAQAARAMARDARPQLTTPDGSAIAMADYARLRRAGWPVSPVLEGRLRLGGHMVTLMGVDVLSFPRPDVSGPDGQIPADLSARLLVNPITAAGLSAEGLSIEATTSVPPGVAMGDIALIARLLDRPSGITRLLLTGPVPKGAPLADIAPGLRLSRLDEAADLARLTDSFHLNLTAFGLLSFAVGLFIVHGTAGLAFEQRRGLYRTLRALGLPLRALTWLVLAELVVLALISGTLGLMLGYLVASALLPDVAATLRGLYGAPVAGGLSLRPEWVASGLAMALLGALTAGAQGVWRLRALPLLAAPAARGWSGAGARQAGAMAAIGAMLVLGGGAALSLWGGLLAGFVFLAGLMLGAALMLPGALALVLGWAEARARGVVAQWVWADMRAQLPGLSLALMALMLALATNIGVGTMVASFRQTFTGWLDQRLAAELYIAARSDRQGAEIADWLSARADAVLPIRFAETRLAGRPARLYGIRDHATYRDNWPLLSAVPDVWDRVAAEQAVLVNEQLARRAGLALGDTLELAPGWQARIAGIYSDYGNPSGQAMVSLPALLDHSPDVPNRRFGIRTAPDNAAALAADLRAAFDLPARGVLDQGAIKAASLAVFDKTFIVTGALNLLTLGVAGFAILIGLLSLWSMRLPHLAPVWAMGMSRARLAGLEVARSLCLAALVVALALPLGLVLAWALLAVINVEAFGWRLPMHLYPLDWVRLALLALLTGGLAALLPARRLLRLPPADLLKVFANER